MKNALEVCKNENETTLIILISNTKYIFKGNYDLNLFREFDHSSDIVDYNNLLHYYYDYIENYPKPIIAAISGCPFLYGFFSFFVRLIAFAKRDDIS